jgi:hypothetical protein
MQPIAKLGIGPMSPEIVEAVFAYAQTSGQSLMLIASKNQIDWDGGYCGDWNTTQYSAYVKTLKAKYPQAKVYLCRDHLGPGFKNHDLKDVYRTIEFDIANGFDLIHVDFCHYKAPYKEILEESKKTIEYILRQKSDMLIEVGTDENTGAFLKDISKVETEMEFFSKIAPIHFFVCQTGSLVKEMNQVGDFNFSFLGKVRDLADRFKVNLKEHNCDYIEAEELRKRRGLVDAVNVAPQFGVLQTLLLLQKCAVYGIDASEFLNEAYASGKWKKWLHNNKEENKHLCALVSGHYIFAKDTYKKLVEKINRHEDFRGVVVNELAKNFDLYLKNLQITEGVGVLAKLNQR